MQKQISLKLLPAESADERAIRRILAASTGYAEKDITGFQPLRRSIDARGRQIWIHLQVNAFIKEPFLPPLNPVITFKDVHRAGSQVIIVGAGPAGLFAALRLMELGIRPVILERGKEVRQRRRDLALLNREGIINPESNYCFGEGGAGTYSDGKLYTRSQKRGDIARVLALFCQFGADETIQYETHPHIGTNKLPGIITAIRQQILDCGGQILFGKKLEDFILKEDRITEVLTHDGNRIRANAVILATGHSARDIFHLLHRKKWAIEAKPFALGVRVEHPQTLIDQAQYHCQVKDPFLPPASYNLVQQVHGKGVFSFCMCPGGIIATASTAPEELVVNGWSPSRRNNPFANSGIVVEVNEKDAWHFLKQQDTTSIHPGPDPLLLMKFQQIIEKKAYTAGGGKFAAPAQRMIDFTKGAVSSGLPDCSYIPGIHSVDLRSVLPAFIHERLQQAFQAFGGKIKGYLTNEAVIVATESRTSSPVRIPRDPEGLFHPQVKNLFPSGEGAGYAGGIMSAAMDGEKIAGMVAHSLERSVYL